MEMTTDTAALMVQVIPTLLIVVALESKFRQEPTEDFSPLARWMMRWGRQSAVFSSVVSIGICIFMVFMDSSNPFASIFVMLSATWLITVLLALFFVVFVAEDRRSGVSEGH